MTLPHYRRTATSTTTFRRTRPFPSPSPLDKRNWSPTRERAAVISRRYHGEYTRLAGKGHCHASVQGVRTDFRFFRSEHPERGYHESDRPPCTDRHGCRSRRVVRGGIRRLHMIAGRMLEAFSPRCEKERLLMECMCGGMDFRSRSAFIVNTGWRAVFARKEDRKRTSRKMAEERPCLPKAGWFRSRVADCRRRRPCPGRFTRKPRCLPPWRTAERISRTERHVRL